MRVPCMSMVLTPRQVHILSYDSVPRKAATCLVRLPEWWWSWFWPQAMTSVLSAHPSEKVYSYDSVQVHSMPCALKRWGSLWYWPQVWAQHVSNAQLPEEVYVSRPKQGHNNVTTYRERAHTHTSAHRSGTTQIHNMSCSLTEVMMTPGKTQHVLSAQPSEEVKSSDPMQRHDISSSLTFMRKCLWPQAKAQHVMFAHRCEEVYVYGPHKATTCHPREEMFGSVPSKWHTCWRSPKWGSLWFHFISEHFDRVNLIEH